MTTTLAATLGEAAANTPERVLLALAALVIAADGLGMLGA